LWKEALYQRLVVKVRRPRQARTMGEDADKDKWRKFL
jgi:hypothetical protein